MTGPRRPSAQTIAVVLALAEQPATWRYGYALCQQLDLKAGSVYPILMRLADRRLLETSWERDLPAGRREPREDVRRAAASPEITFCRLSSKALGEGEGVVEHELAVTSFAEELSCIRRMNERSFGEELSFVR